MAGDDLIRVHFPPDEADGVTGEALRARPLGPDTAEIAHIPMRVRDVSPGDVVRFEPATGAYLETLSHSPNSVVRAELSDETEADEVRRLLRELGCRTAWSSRHGRLAASVPPRADYELVAARLSDLDDDGVLTWEEASYRHGG